MPNKLFLSLVLAVLYFFCFNTVSAEIIINEFVSDPESGSEWVELLNTSSLDIDLASWRWTELTSPGTETERESSPKSLNGTISAGGVFVFELKSVLNNLGDSIGLYNGVTLEDRVTYGKVDGFSKDLDAPGKGKSGAFISGVWKNNQDPTKNEINPSSSSHNPEAGDTSEEDNEKETFDSNEDIPKKFQKPEAEIKGDKIALVGIPFKLEGVAFGNDGQQEYTGRYFWNFGDGDFREVKVKNADKFTHTYFYPGEYDILFEYYPNYFTDIPDASDKLTVKVIDPKVFISKVGDVNDFFVELTNNTNFNVNISGWRIIGSFSVFTFPKNSNLSPRKSITLSPQLTGLSVLDKDNITLADSEGKVIHKYITSTKPVYGEKTYTGEKEINKVSAKETTYSRNNLVASALFGEDEEDKEEIVVPVWFSILSFVFLVGVGVSGAYFIRKRGIMKRKVSGEDFEILDE